MPKFYADIGDTIEHTKFSIRIPDDYETVIPFYYQKYPERRPLYSEFTSMSESRLPIISIVDLCVNNVPFDIREKSEVLIIVQLLEKYIQCLKDLFARGTPTDEDLLLLENCKTGLATLHSIGKVARQSEKNNSKLRQESKFAAILTKFRGL